MFHLLWIAVIGLVVGAIAKFFMPGKDPGGIWITMALGILGSIVATWLGRIIGLYGPDASAGFIMSILGAVLVLAIYHFIRRKTVNA
jgi:uncharacterized membrane protein YeaQ/YmgE (transglycosylase-associated protein family)